MEDLSFEKAAELAETLRSTIETTSIDGYSVTSSFGLSTKQFGAMDLQHLIDQADQCLYVAKRQGRNQVVRWDECTDEQLNISPMINSDDKDVGLHDSALHALHTVLTINNPAIARHSLRVASLADAVGKGHVIRSDELLLRQVALLHDIGLVGTGLTKNKMALQILGAAGASQRLFDIISQIEHHSIKEFAELPMVNFPRAISILLWSLPFATILTNLSACNRIIR